MTSRMRKSELVAECARLNLDTSGTIPVLRSRLKGPRVPDSQYLSALDLDNVAYDLLNPFFKNTNILCIEQIINPDLERRFFECQSDIIKRVGFCETVTAFHGTSNDALFSIVKNGFDVTKSKRQALGFGTYFALDPQLSMMYSNTSHKILLCEVLVGDSSDSTLDRLQSPSIFVSKHSMGAIPRYVITYDR